MFTKGYKRFRKGCLQSQFEILTKLLHVKLLKSGSVSHYHISYSSNGQLSQKIRPCKDPKGACKWTLTGVRIVLSNIQGIFLMEWNCSLNSILYSFPFGFLQKKTRANIARQVSYFRSTRGKLKVLNRSRMSFAGDEMRLYRFASWVGWIDKLWQKVTYFGQKTGGDKQRPTCRHCVHRTHENISPSSFDAVTTFS